MQDHCFYSGNRACETSGHPSGKSEKSSGRIVLSGRSSAVSECITDEGISQGKENIWLKKVLL